jgi:RNA polymerase sigma-70 factor, ECF subfamily
VFPTDEQLLPLIERMAAGDGEAVLPFVELVGPWVHAAELRLCGTTVAATVMTEDVLTELWRTAPLYDHHLGQPKTWIMAVSRAHGATWVERRRGKEKRLKSRADAGELLKDVEGGADPVTVAALERIDPEQRRILRAAWYAERPAQGLVAQALPALAEALAATEGSDS